MKKRPLLDVLENASLVGLGVGSVASVLFQQAFYATAPLSLLVVLGMLNRRQLERRAAQNSQSALNQLDRRLTQKVEQLTLEVEQMPTPETIHKIKRGVLIKNRELAGHFYNEITALQNKLEQRIAPLEQQNLPALRQDLENLGDRYQQLVEGLALLNDDIAQLQNQDSRDQIRADQQPDPTADSREQATALQEEITDLRGDLDSLTYYIKANSSDLQERISQLDRQLSQLAVSSASSSSADPSDPETGGDRVSRQEWEMLTGNMQALQQNQETLKETLQAIESAAIGLRRSLKPKPKSADPAASGANPAESGTTESELTALFAQHLGESSLAGAELYPDLQALATRYLKNLRSQLRVVYKFTQQLAQQQQKLQDQIHRLPQSLDMVALQQQLKDLSHRIPSAESTFDAFQARMQAVVQQELEAINDQLQNLPASPQHQLLLDFNAEPAASPAPAPNHALLEEALQQTQKRLILICPWSDEGEFDDVLLQKLEAFLSQRRHLDLGWCHLTEQRQERLLGRVRRGWNNQPEQTALQATLKKLLKLKRAYPEYFQFKILGTSEHFLVCDRAFAVVGIADSLKTTTPFADLQLKLRTTDPDVINRLIDRFDNPTLDPDDLTAYWNRAVTRCDLGDKGGAIEDFDHILSRQPDDWITLNSRGVALYDLGDREAALLDFTQSIHINPRQNAAYLNRGFMRSEQGDLWGAISDYTLAIQMAPEEALAYFYRGMAWQKREQHQQALSDFSEAIRLAPGAAVVCYYRGLARQKLGQLQDAIVDLQKAAEHFTARGSKTNAEKARKHLAKLQRELEQPQVATPRYKPAMSDAEPTLPLTDITGTFPPVGEEDTRPLRSIPAFNAQNGQQAIAAAAASEGGEEPFPSQG